MIAAAIERVGIPTVSISLLKEITSVIKPPRSLFVPFPLGYPLGEPNNPTLQHSTIQSGLALFSHEQTPVLEDFNEK